MSKVKILVQGLRSKMDPCWTNFSEIYRGRIFGIWCAIFHGKFREIAIFYYSPLVHKS